MQPRRAVLAANLAAFTASTCVDEEFAPLPAAVQAVYAEDPRITQLVPYPSNRYAVADAATRTGLRVAVSPETTGDLYIAGYPPVVQRLGETDGFSTAGGIALGFDGPIEASGFAGPNGGKADHEIDPSLFTRPGAPIVLVDVDPGSPERGKVFGLIPRYYEQAKDDFYPIDEFTIVAKPLVPLEPKRRYLFAATNRIVGKNGVPVEPSPATRELVFGPPGDAYAASVHEGLDVLESSVGVSREDVVVVSVFTTTSARDEMVGLAEAVRASPPPVLSAPWEVAETSESDARVRFRAQFRAPEYRAEDGTFQIEDGVPVPQRSAEIEVFLVFSNRDVSGPRPVVIFQHGLGGDKGGAWGAAERLADLGAAVVSIDSPEHGFRGDGSGNMLQSVLAFFAIDAETSAFDLGAARDNFRQMAADQLELVEFLRAQPALDLLPVGAPDGLPDLDVSELLYIGHSFGAVQGPTIFALAPEIKHAVWNVGGDNLTQLIHDSPTFGILVDAIAPPETTDGQLARFFAATQAIIDPGDPVNFARFAFEEPLTDAPGWGPRSVLLQEVMDDAIVPNSSTESVARAAGLELFDPVRHVPGLPVGAAPASANLPGGSTGVLYQFATMHGGMKAQHGELYFSPEARGQYVEFFRSALADGVGTVVAP